MGTLLFLKDQLKEKKRGNEYIYLCSRDDSSDIEIKSKVYVIQEQDERNWQFSEDTALYQEETPAMFTRKCTGQDINDMYTAFGCCSDLLFLLKKMRKLKWFQMVLAGVSTRSLNLRKSELPISSFHPALVGSLTLKYNCQEAATSLLQEITKYQQVVINHLDIVRYNKTSVKKSFDDLFSTSVRLSKDTKILRIMQSEVTSAACQRFGEDLYGCLPLRQESLNQHVALQVNEQCPFLETLDLSETVMKKSDFYALVKVQKLPHLKILNLSRINLSGCLGDILSAGSPSLEKLVLRQTLLKNIDISYLASILGQRLLPKLKELDLFCSCIYIHKECFHKCEEHLIVTSPPQTIEKEGSRLQLLKMAFSSFSPNEIKNLVHASQSSCLSLVCLSNVNLQGQLRDIFGLDDMPSEQPNISAQMGHIDHPRFPFLQVLDLCSTNLETDDLNFLAESIGHGYFVNLRYLDVTNHVCTGLKSSTYDLVRSCVKHYNKHKIYLVFHVDGFAVEFWTKIRSMCRGSNVHLIEKIPRKNVDLSAFLLDQEAKPGAN